MTVIIITATFLIPQNVILLYIYVPFLRRGGHIVFGADLVDVSVGVTLSCLHNIV